MGIGEEAEQIEEAEQKPAEADAAGLDVGDVGGEEDEVADAALQPEGGVVADDGIDEKEQGVSEPDVACASTAGYIDVAWVVAAGLEGDGHRDCFGKFSLGCAAGEGSG